MTLPLVAAGLSDPEELAEDVVIDGAVATGTGGASPAVLAALRRQLDEVLHPGGTTPGLSTGVAALDRVLPGGGLPRGRLTEVAGTRSSGRTTLLRQVVGTTLQQGGWVAWVDATRTLAPRDWATLPRGATGVGGAPAQLCVVRPHDAARAAWCADVLLRSGAFALVVLDGVPPLPRAVGVRLTRLARDAGAALVVLGDGRGGTQLGSAVRLRMERRRERGTWCDESRQLRITVEKGGSHRLVEVSCAIGVARRLCTHSEVPDRRGVARAGRHARAGGGATGTGRRAARAGARD